MSETRIVAFLCHWCSYTGADLAGTTRIHYSPNIRIIRVMCSGRIEPQFILKAFREGADGVLVCGCHPGDCHYHEGNHKCLRRFVMLKQMLGPYGIEDGRTRLEWVSASEGDHFAKLADEFAAQIKALGPLGGQAAFVEGTPGATTWAS